MLGLIGLAINCIAAFRLLDTGIFVAAAASAVASFWSWGVMMNYRDNPQAAPNWSATLNIITFGTGVVLLLVSLAI